MENKMEDVNKLAFVISSILTFLGISILAGALAIRAVTANIWPMVFGAFKLTGVLRPDEYLVNLAGIYIVAAVCIVVGTVLSIVFYKKGSR